MEIVAGVWQTWGLHFLTLRKVFSQYFLSEVAESLDADLEDMEG